MTKEMNKSPENASRLSAVGFRAVGAICVGLAATGIGDRIAESHEFTDTDGIMFSTLIGVGIFALGTGRTIDNKVDTSNIAETREHQVPPKRDD